MSLLTWQKIFVVAEQFTCICVVCVIEKVFISSCLVF